MLSEWDSRRRATEREGKLCGQKLSPTEVLSKNSTDFNSFLFYGCVSLWLTADPFQWRSVNKLRDYYKGQSATVSIFITEQYLHSE